jgi:hypothetical protein
MTKKHEQQRPPDSGAAHQEPDEYTGIGGTYIRDPKTGKRSPAAIDDQPQSITGEDPDHGSEK